MKYLLSMFFCAAAFCAAAQQVWTPDNGDGTFTNPIMWGDWPDPDIIRVGDDFYMVSTSMHYVPGVSSRHVEGSGQLAYGRLCRGAL